MTPVSAPADRAADQVGERIRALRLARGMTLVQLAGSAHLSHPFLSQLERGLTRPSLASLERIAHALGTSQVELLTFDPGVRDAAPVEGARVLSAGDGRLGPYGLDGTARVLLGGAGPFRALEVRAENTAYGAAFAHAEHEWVYLLAGAMEIELDGRAERLTPGDSASLPGGVAHRWRSADGAPYALLVVKEQVRAPTPHPRGSARPTPQGCP